MSSAPTTGQGDDFFRALTAWERAELLALPVDFFGDTITDSFEMDTEPYPSSLDTRRLPTIVDIGD